jgi:hypothetical protein
MIMSGPPRSSGHQADCFSPPPADTPADASPPSDRGRLPAYPPERVEAVLNYLAQHPDEAGRPVILTGGRVAVGFVDHGCQHLDALAQVVPGGKDVIEVFQVPNSAAAVERAHDKLIAALTVNDPRLAGFDFAGFGPDDVAGHESVRLTDSTGEAQADDLQRLLTRDFADGNASLYSVSVSHEPLPTEW